MKKIKKSEKILFIPITIFIFLVSINIVHASGFVSIQKQFTKNATQGETVEFTILFLNAEDTPVQLSMQIKQFPKNWKVEIKPDNFLLNKSKTGPPYDPDGEYIGIPGIGDVKGFPVKIVANIPNSAKFESYDIFVTARSGSLGSGISALQERTFKFTTNVNPEVSFKNKEEDQTIQKVISSISEGVKNAINTITGMFSSNSFVSILALAISVIVILAISWLIYRH